MLTTHGNLVVIGEPGLPLKHASFPFEPKQGFGVICRHVDILWLIMIPFIGILISYQKAIHKLGAYYDNRIGSNKKKNQY